MRVKWRKYEGADGDKHGRLPTRAKVEASEGIYHWQMGNANYNLVRSLSGRRPVQCVRPKEFLPHYPRAREKCHERHGTESVYREILHQVC